MNMAIYIPFDSSPVQVIQSKLCWMASSVVSDILKAAEVLLYRASEEPQLQGLQSGTQEIKLGRVVLISKTSARFTVPVLTLGPGNTE